MHLAAEGLALVHPGKSGLAPAAPRSGMVAPDHHHPDKTLVGVRHLPCVLVADRPGITGLAEPLWTHVLFHAPYNQDSDGPRLSCWEDWPDVLGPLL